MHKPTSRADAGKLLHCPAELRSGTSYQPAARCEQNVMMRCQSPHPPSLFLLPMPNCTLCAFLSSLLQSIQRSTHVVGARASIVGLYQLMNNASRLLPLWSSDSNQLLLGILNYWPSVSISIGTGSHQLPYPLLASIISNLYKYMASSSDNTALQSPSFFPLPLHVLFLPSSSPSLHHCLQQTITLFLGLYLEDTIIQQIIVSDLRSRH